MDFVHHKQSTQARALRHDQTATLALAARIDKLQQDGVPADIINDLSRQLKIVQHTLNKRSKQLRRRHR